MRRIHRDLLRDTSKFRVCFVSRWRGCSSFRGAPLLWKASGSAKLMHVAQFIWGWVPSTCVLKASANEHHTDVSAAPLAENMQFGGLDLLLLERCGKLRVVLNGVSCFQLSTCKPSALVS